MAPGRLPCPQRKADKQSEDDLPPLQQAAADCEKQASVAVAALTSADVVLTTYAVLQQVGGYER